VAASTVIDATGRRAWIARRLGARQLPDAPLVAVWALGRRAAGGHATRTYIETEADGWWYGAVLPCGAPLAAFHCPPKLATWLAREPGRWRPRLAESRLLANVLEAGSFRDAHPFRADARGLTLEPVCGPGWFAVGDAALSFDPVASQGLFNSVASAAMAARAATSGDPHAARARYVERLSEVRAVYRDRLRELAIRRASTGAVVSW
jgi:flavin-dependent dehydrogenase